MKKLLVSLVALMLVFIVVQTSQASDQNMKKQITGNTGAIISVIASNNNAGLITAEATEGIMYCKSNNNSGITKSSVMTGNTYNGLNGFLSGPFNLSKSNINGIEVKNSANDLQNVNNALKENSVNLTSTVSGINNATIVKKKIHGGAEGVRQESQAKKEDKKTENSQSFTKKSDKDENLGGMKCSNNKMKRNNSVPSLVKK